MLKLFASTKWDSPYVMSAFVALREKGVPFELQILDLERGDQRQADFAPAVTGRVPAIEHDGFWLAESSAIAEYVDEAFPGPRLFPEDVRERARARQVQGWIRSDLMALREERPTTTMFYAKATTPLSKAGERARDKLLAAAGRLIRPGATTMFRTWSIADCDLSLMLHRLILNDHPVPDHVRDYARATWERPSVQEFVKHPRPPLD